MSAKTKNIGLFGYKKMMYCACGERMKVSSTTSKNGSVFRYYRCAGKCKKLYNEEQINKTILTNINFILRRPIRTYYEQHQTKELSIIYKEIKRLSKSDMSNLFDALNELNEKAEQLKKPLPVIPKRVSEQDIAKHLFFQITFHTSYILLKFDFPINAKLETEYRIEL